MCGINGFISKNSIMDAQLRINNMNASLAHRGPDADGEFVSRERKIAMGQRRLAIVDLDARSNQPFHLDDDTVIAFNGEIYNYLELRKDIKHVFRTQSDTEVLASGIKNNGIEWIKECNGMFAFCLLDKINNQAILARDRLGIKPLYYYYDKNLFIFSSEIKGILNSGLVKAEFNSEAIDEYLGNRYIREPYTFFKNIYQLPAGHYITVSSEIEIEIKRYWDLPSEFNLEEEYMEDEIYCSFKDEVNKAIKRRMLADVTVGAYLSGGVDCLDLLSILSPKISISAFAVSTAFIRPSISLISACFLSSVLFS